MERKKKQTKKQPNLFDDEKKRMLAFQVSQYPCLWNLTHDEHKRPDAHLAAWEKIAVAVEESADRCKTSWKSLRDGLRYRVTSLKSKSGDPAPDVEEEDEGSNEILDEAKLQGWKFWEDLKFLKQNKPNRKTISSSQILESSLDADAEGLPREQEVLQNSERNQSQTDTSKENTPGSSKPQKRVMTSNYDYALKTKKSDPLEDGTEKIVNSINSLVELRRGSNTNTIDLKYLSMYQNLDRMLKKLPDIAVEELNFQFISLVREELKKQ